MGYMLWLQNHCKRTWEIQKCMGYKRVWVLLAMGYKGFDCTTKFNLDSLGLVHPIGLTVIEIFT